MNPRETVKDLLRKLNESRQKARDEMTRDRHMESLVSMDISGAQKTEGIIALYGLVKKNHLTVIAIDEIPNYGNDFMVLRTARLERLTRSVSFGLAVNYDRYLSSSALARRITLEEVGLGMREDLRNLRKRGVEVRRGNPKQVREAVFSGKGIIVEKTEIAVKT